MSANAKFEVFPMVLPEMGPRTVPDKISFVAGQVEELDLTQLIDNGWLDYISGVYVDNFGNAGTITLVCSGSNQRFIIAPDTAGYYPLLIPNSPKVTLLNTESETVTFQWYNIPIFPVVVKGATLPAPVSPTGPTVSEFTLSMAGGDEQLIPAGGASHFLYLENPTGNSPVTVNLAGGDASVSGITMAGGDIRQFASGIANAIHIAGAAAETFIAFGG